LEIIDCPSPNFGDRPGNATVDLIVLHYTAMTDADAASKRLCDPETQVSAHYLIDRDGKIFRLVDEEKRAWHAGAGSWAAQDDVNSHSIGIELDNDGTSPFTDPLMAGLETLLADILGRHKLSAKAVIGHSDMAPDRKSDPGPHFDWQRLAKAGLSIWPEPALKGDFMRDAVTFGYSPHHDEATICRAFRARFRPFATGPLNVADISLMAGLARQYPADGATHASQGPA
jgi:N-acetylmuramoyl-L-alanine amidase